jgi:hypothetical protein
VALDFLARTIYTRQMRVLRASFMAFAIAGCSPVADGSAPDLGSAPDPADAAVVDAAVDATPAPDLAPAGPLDIPPRDQWTNGDGYCGETSIQSIGLFYGAWISEQLVRTLAGGELLLGSNETKALDALHFRYSLFANQSAQPQFQSFMAWLKSNLLNGVPCIFAAYVTDGNNDPDYDHIMPAVGWDSNDVLVFNDNYGDRLLRAMSDLSGTRQSCSYDTVHGGCIPAGTDYGVAVTGLADDAHATLPVSISVGQSSEPNVSTGATPSAMNAMVTVRALTPGQSYALLRYDDYTKVPTAATAAQMLTSAYSFRQDFTATSSSWSWADPNSFPSNGATYYRCVPR